MHISMSYQQHTNFLLGLLNWGSMGSDFEIDILPFAS